MYFSAASFQTLYSVKRCKTDDWFLFHNKKEYTGHLKIQFLFCPQECPIFWRRHIFEGEKRSNEECIYKRAKKMLELEKIYIQWDYSINFVAFLYLRQVFALERWYPHAYIWAITSLNTLLSNSLVLGILSLLYLKILINLFFFIIDLFNKATSIVTLLIFLILFYNNSLVSCSIMKE